MDNVDWALLTTFFSTAITIGLLYIYLRNYKMVKSKFCTGLIIFALLLLIQNIWAFYLQTTMLYHCSYEISGPILVLNVLEMLGLGALFYVTWKPEM